MNKLRVRERAHVCPCAQVTGAQFLFRLWAQGHGGILADDMGERPRAALSDRPSLHRCVCGSCAGPADNTFVPIGCILAEAGHDMRAVRQCGPHCVCLY